MSDTNMKTAMENLQKQVEKQRQTIDKLTNENKQLRAKLKGGAGGVESGPSRQNAAAALAAKLGGKPRGGGGGGGVETGPSRSNAAAALMAKLGKGKPPGGGGGGGAGAGGAGNDRDKIFAKYEKMMKLGISIHGALGRMVQNGEKAELIDAFKKKHAEKLGGVSEESHDLTELGLTAKRKIVLQRNIKMKRLHWDPLNPTRVPNSIWEDLDESQIKYDPKKFELNFQVRERKQVVQESSKLNSSNSNEKRLFVTKKRAQQVMIGIRGLGLTNKQLRDVLHNMDEKVMTQEKLSGLMDIIPSEDEQTQAEKEVMAYHGNYKQFGEAEQFFFNLCDFYHLEQRLRLWAFRMQFQELTQNLLEQFKQVQKTCDKVRNNKSLKQLLTIILAFGNHMNAGTRKGQAFGFDMKILAQLSNIKTHDNSRSLLMYVYEFCDQKYPKVLNVLTELKPILKISASSETDVLNSLYDKIKENMKELKDIIESDDIEESYDMDDSFVAVMKKFHKKSQPSMKKFHMTVGNVLVSTKRLMKKFAFGSEEQPERVEKLFSLLYQFLLDLETSKQKLVKLEKERAKKRRLRLKKKNKNDKSKLGKPRIGSGHGKASVKTGGRGRQEDDSKDDAEWSWDKYKGGTLSKALNTTLAFEESLDKAKSQLAGHIKNKSSFVHAGGDLSKLDFVDKRRASTMRRVSSMYQQDQEEAKKLAEARQKARIARMQKGMKLPDLPQSVQLKSHDYRAGRIANHVGTTPTSGGGRYQVGGNHDQPLPAGGQVMAPKRFDRGTAPAIQAGVQLSAGSSNGKSSQAGSASPPSKPLPKSSGKDKKLPPNKHIPPPPQTGSVPNLYQSQPLPMGGGHGGRAGHAGHGGHAAGHNKGKHKGPSHAPQAHAVPPIQQAGQYTAAQQQWMAQQSQNQPNLYATPYAQGQGQGQAQQPQAQWTQAQLNAYYAQQQQQQAANQQAWNQYYAQGGQQPPRRN